MQARQAQGERGSVMMVVISILVALFAAGAVVLYLQLSNTRSTALVRAARAALYCSEAGLQASRGLIVNNYPQWNDLLDPAATKPSWYPPNASSPTGYGILGEAGDDDPASPDNDDWLVWVTDDDDEFPGPLDPARDNNLRIMVHARCLLFPDQPREIVELVTSRLMPTAYKMGDGDSSLGLNDQTSVP